MRIKRGSYRNLTEIFRLRSVTLALLKMTVDSLEPGSKLSTKMAGKRERSGYRLGL